ncbi:MAG: hypothetical protein ACRCSV_03240 [Chlamydiales bacterium]
MSSYSSSNSKLLGDCIISFKNLIGVEEALKRLNQEFSSFSNEKEKVDAIARSLYQCIVNSKSSFLLSAVIGFIDAVRQTIYPDFILADFELWLNQFSTISPEENYRIRSNIMGKYIPRDEYQIYFPIGMNRKFFGPHFVTGHDSPDLDTTIASFWGWVDAFAAQVTNGLHIWNIPGGLQLSQVEVAFLFSEIMQGSSDLIIMRTRNMLSVSSFDLMTQRGFIKKYSEDISDGNYERQLHATVLINKLGHYIGDWRDIDVERVQQIVILFDNCLHWIENHLQDAIISLLAKKIIDRKTVGETIADITNFQLGSAKPVRLFTKRQKKYMQEFLIRVIHVDKGLQCSILELMLALERQGFCEFTPVFSKLKHFIEKDIFSFSSHLDDARCFLFSHIEKIRNLIENLFQSIRISMRSLGIALQIKRDVFGHLPHYVTKHVSLEELKIKIGNYSHLTVTMADSDGKLTPIGVVHAVDMQQECLGTVSLRDFSNKNEVEIPSYLEVISIIDHHKSILETKSPSVSSISDAQSSNVIVAEKAFQINDRYSMNGMSQTQIEVQIKELQISNNARSLRIMRRLLQRKMNFHRGQNYFIDPIREYTEYRHFVYAILDDTDLLTKVTRRDVECMCSLLNRMKSLTMQQEIEIIDFDDIDEDTEFVSLAAKKLLQNEDLYSLYSKIYDAKEQSLNQLIEESVHKDSIGIFADTKIQNHCVSVGQTKIFPNNYAQYVKHRDTLRYRWVEKSNEQFVLQNHIDLYLHMISTLTSAKQLYTGSAFNHAHNDELWIWIPNYETSIDHLQFFLTTWKQLPELEKNITSIEVYGKDTDVYEKILKQSFLDKLNIIHFTKHKFSICVIYYTAGCMNSRKTMISPFIPRVN